MMRKGVLLLGVAGLLAFCGTGTAFAAGHGPGARHVCEKANKGAFLDLDGLAYACLFPANNHGAQRTCERSGGTYIDLDGVTYACLFPDGGPGHGNGHGNRLGHCERPNGGTLIDLDGLAYICLLPQNNHGAKGQCQGRHKGTFVDLDGLAYACLLPGRAGSAGASSSRTSATSRLIA